MPVSWEEIASSRVQKGPRIDHDEVESRLAYDGMKEITAAPDSSE
jgi:hypothetical protein